MIDSQQQAIIKPGLKTQVQDNIYVAELQRRAELLLRIRDNKTASLAIHLYYKDHPVDFIRDWMFTYDPRVQPAYLPFVLWPRQEKYIEWLMDLWKSKKDGLVEKSRDVGATYLNMSFSIWLWRYYQAKIGFGSRKEVLVDRIGDADSIFEKGRIILSRMPAEILPEGFLVDMHTPFMKIINPENGSTITGETGDNIGRGGRSSIYFKDESAFYERPDRIDSALSQNSDVKIDISTPNGVGNPFYKKRFGGKVPVFVFDWRDDPRKNENWYNYQVETLDPVIVAQEIDRDYSASVEQICIPMKWIKAAVNFDIQSSGEVISSLDVADEGGDANALIIRKGVKVFFVDSWYKGNTTQTTRKAVSICREHDGHILRYDPIGVGAGVKGEISNENYKDIVPVPVNFSSNPTQGNYENTKRKNEDMFSNLRAQSYWVLRRRFEKTYEKVNGIRDHPLEELISIPNHSLLIQELSQPKYDYSDSGKIVIESKKKMKSRSINSPNLADSLAINFSPADEYRKAGIWGKTTK